MRSSRDGILSLRSSKLSMLKVAMRSLVAIRSRLSDGLKFLGFIFTVSHGASFEYTSLF